jgi:hypothetical protein
MLASQTGGWPALRFTTERLMGTTLSDTTGALVSLLVIVVRANCCVGGHRGSSCCCRRRCCKTTHRTLSVFPARVLAACTCVSLCPSVYSTPFAVAVDRERRALVIAVRGTLSMNDCITDALAGTSKLPHLPPSTPTSTHSIPRVPPLRRGQGLGRAAECRGDGGGGAYPPQPCPSTTLPLPLPLQCHSMSLTTLGTWALLWTAL